MVRTLLLCFLFTLATHTVAVAERVLQNQPIDFYGEDLELPLSKASFIDFKEPLSEAAIFDFYSKMEKAGYESLLQKMLWYRAQSQTDDWLYYQLVRKTAETISPKKESYIRYTLYKWYFLLKSGYDAQLSIAGDTMLFYAQCDENIYDIPSYTIGNRKYVCLNYHDYHFNLDFTKLQLTRILLPDQSGKSFSYRLTHVPDFKNSDYRYKNVRFEYNDIAYHFSIKISEQVKNVYANYPVADYHLYFNAPMSRETYNSIIPALKKATAGLKVKNGVDYLMRFTRYAFLYRPDKENFGKEKRLSPEQTLLYEHSDCEDRSALFFFLVKELYNLPMVVLTYPNHVTIAVKLDGAKGASITYNGEKYYICEPTPQAADQSIGEIPRALRSAPYEVAYAYHP